MPSPEPLIAPDAATPLATESAAVLVDAGDVVPGAGGRGFGIIFWLSVGWISLVILCALLAGVLPIKNPDQIIGATALGPGGHHLLGTDGVGRDILARLVYGARVSMIVGFASIAVGLVVGGGLGLLSGYFKGRIGALIMGLVDVLLAFPILVLAIAIVAFLGPHLLTVVIAIAVVSVGPIARVARAATLACADREYVIAARALGAKPGRILRREVLPNVAVPMLSFALVAVAVAIVGEAALSFLGLSVRPPTASWGGMIADGKTNLRHSAYGALIPSAAIFLTVLAFNFIGDTVKAHFDRRQGAL